MRVYPAGTAARQSWDVTIGSCGRMHAASVMTSAAGATKRIALTTTSLPAQAVNSCGGLRRIVLDKREEPLPGGSGAASYLWNPMSCDYETSEYKIKGSRREALLPGYAYQT